MSEMNKSWPRHEREIPAGARVNEYVVECRNLLVKYINMLESNQTDWDLKVMFMRGLGLAWEREERELEKKFGIPGDLGPYTKKEG